MTCTSTPLQVTESGSVRGPQQYDNASKAGVLSSRTCVVKVHEIGLLSLRLGLRVRMRNAIFGENDRISSYNGAIMVSPSETQFKKSVCVLNCVFMVPR
jgi:hypothetical protein